MKMWTPCMTFTRERLRFCSGAFLITLKDLRSLHAVNRKKAETSSKTKKEAIASKISEVECIVKKLQDKHGNQYSGEKCNAWTHLIHVGKHDSHDDPPDLPYFRGTKKRKLQTASEGRENSPPSPQAASKSSPSIITSPSKRVGLRSQCIEQLVKWHSLLEKGAISQLQYDEMQKAIMEEIKSNY